jgi:hypothetical protein
MRGVVLQGEDAIGMSSSVLLITALQRLNMALRSLVVYTHDAVAPGSCELTPVIEVINAEDLIASLSDRMQTLAGLDMPV